MRTLLFASMVAVTCVGTPLTAQTPVSKVTPTLPSIYPDTVIIMSLTLGGGAIYATAPITLDHRLLGGLRPTQYRTSKFADFRDAQWTAYPVATPTFTGSNSGVCAGQNSLLMVAHLQVRAPKPNLVRGFVHSNIARDTTCIFIGG